MMYVSVDRIRIKIFCGLVIGSSAWDACRDIYQIEDYRYVVVKMM